MVPSPRGSAEFMDAASLIDGRSVLVTIPARVVPVVTEYELGGLLGGLVGRDGNSSRL